MAADTLTEVTSDGETGAVLQDGSLDSKQDATDRRDDARVLDDAAWQTHGAVSDVGMGV